MLLDDGSPWKYFEWQDPDDHRSQREALEGEGIVFDERGKALQASRITYEALM
jgi:hypothetical protein